MYKIFFISFICSMCSYVKVHAEGIFESILIKNVKEIHVPNCSELDTVYTPMPKELLNYIRIPDTMSSVMVTEEFEKEDGEIVEYEINYKPTREINILGYLKKGLFYWVIYSVNDERYNGYCSTTYIESFDRTGESIHKLLYSYSGEYVDYYNFGKIDKDSIIYSYCFYPRNSTSNRNCKDYDTNVKFKRYHMDKNGHFITNDNETYCLEHHFWEYGNYSNMNTGAEFCDFLKSLSEEN